MSTVLYLNASDFLSKGSVGLDHRTLRREMPHGEGHVTSSPRSTVSTAEIRSV